MKSYISEVAISVLALFGSANAASGAGRDHSEVASKANQRTDGLQDRDVCRADNVLRALRNPARAAVATSFCQEYIHVPISTGTITFTPIVAGLKTVVATTTAVYTETVVETNIYTETVDVTKTVVVTQTVTVPPGVVKRTEATIPPFLTRYPASRLSSACSCLSVPPPSTVVTVTGPPLTYWQTSTYFTTASELATVTLQTSVATTLTVYGTVSSTVTVTVTA